MSHESQDVQVRQTRAGHRWRVTSRPDARIRVEELEMTDAIRRRLTGGGYLPPPNLERYRAFWNLPRKG